MPQFLKDRLRDGVVILALAAAFTFFGVYSSGEGSVWLRFAMWMVTMIVGAAASNIVIPLVFDRHLVGDRLPVKILVSAALIAVPVTVTLYLFMGLLGNWVPPDDLPVQYLYVYAICLVLTLAGVLRQYGIGCEVYPEAKKLGQQLKYADQRGFSIALIAGDREFAAGTLQVKNLKQKISSEVAYSHEEPSALLKALENHKQLPNLLATGAGQAFDTV